MYSFSARTNGSGSAGYGHCPALHTTARADRASYTIAVDLLDRVDAIVKDVIAKVVMPSFRLSDPKTSSRKTRPATQTISSPSSTRPPSDISFMRSAMSFPAPYSSVRKASPTTLHSLRRCPRRRRHGSSIRSTARRISPKAIPISASCLRSFNRDARARRGWQCRPRHHPATQSLPSTAAARESMAGESNRHGRRRRCRGAPCTPA